MRRLSGPALVLATLALTLAGPPRDASADTLEMDPELGYLPIEELSYEAIVRPGAGFEAELAIRIALVNNSSSPQDVVEAVGLPRGAELTGFSVDFDGEWIEGKASGASEKAGLRDPGSVFVHPLAPEDPHDLPAVEVVAFGLAAQSTTQIELRVRVAPTLRGDRWQLELPRRHASVPNLMDRRRVLVQGLPAGEGFWVDDSSNAGTPYMVTRAEDAVLVEWPAHLSNTSLLDGSYEITRDPTGEGGRVRVALRLGTSKPVEPDHVLLIVDRSKSGASSLPREAGDMLEALLGQLPAGTTFDAISFARTAEPLLTTTPIADRRAPTRADELALTELRKGLAGLQPSQGTDLRAAMQLAGERLHERKAKAPLVLVVTDGMLPPSVSGDEVEQALLVGLGERKRPEVLFVVDDPLLNLRGLPADHPIADLAAGLGARLSLETLANLGPANVGELLAAPKVLGDLDLGLPDDVILDEPLPVGLVAGDFVVIEGSYADRVPSKLRVRGRLGASKISISLRASKRPEPLRALAAAQHEGDREQVVSEGLALPDWYTPSMRRTTAINLAQAGAVGWQATGQLDASIVRRELRIRVLPRARACYNQALTRNRSLAGHVEFGMEVGKGEVMLAGLDKTELSADDPELVRCLEQAAWALDVPAGNLDSQVYRIRYPLELIPPKKSASGGTSEHDAMLVEHLVRSAEVLADYQTGLKEAAEDDE